MNFVDVLRQDFHFALRGIRRRPAFTAIVTTTLAVQPGAAHHLAFRFGGWRNRVYDGYGTDVTRFGMWSNYSVMLVLLAVVGVACCGVLGLAVGSNP